jgi:hypothetical protein
MSGDSATQARWMSVHGMGKGSAVGGGGGVGGMRQAARGEG